MFLSGWIYSTHCYNAATFGDIVTAYYIGINTFRNDDNNYALDSRHQPNYYNNISHKYEHCINVEHNTPVELYTIPLLDNILLH